MATGRTSSEPPVEPRHRGAAPILDSAALAAFEEATLGIAGVLDLEAVLQLIVDRVRDLVGARYAALGIVGPAGGIERFITSGLSSAERTAIGHLPRGRGLLGLIIEEGRSYRIPVIADHPASTGFPPNHPPMTSFLGVPIESEGAPVGNFYLTDKAGGAAFTAADERLTELFAAHAGIAIENARLHATAGELAVIRERDRIGRELHDGIIQSLYAVALTLEDLPDVMAEAPAEGEVRVDRAIDALQMAIRDIRNFIYGLEPETLDGRDVRAGLAALAEEFRRNTLVDVDAELEEGAASGIGPEHGRDVLQLAREALSNAARHAGARRVTLELRGGPDAWQLTIADDGRGFDPAAVDRRGRRGISNMTARAEIVGASFHLESRPGAGTRIIITMPAAAPDRPTP